MSGEITLGVTGDTGLLLNRISCSGRVAGERRTDGTSYITLSMPEEAKPQYLKLLAEYMIDRYEPSLLGAILLRQHGYLSNTQRREAMKNLNRFDSDRELGYPIRRQLIKNSLERYFEENDRVFLDGFVAFRLSDYERLLERLAERLVDTYLVQQEYEEFLELLKYFVQTQENRPSLVHVIVLDNGGYQVVDTQDNDITRECIEELGEDAGGLHDLTPDDILISMLISIAPRTIVVHNRQYIRNVELFSTIAKVFDGSITYCSGCSMCMRTPVLV